MDKSYDHGEAMDVIAETLRRNREKTDRALAERQERVKEEIRETKKARYARALVRFGRPTVIGLWRLLVLATQAGCWILMPLACLAFAQWFTMGINVESGHGALAAVATYVVAGIAGIKGAARASRQIGDNFRNINI